MAQLTFWQDVKNVQLLKVKLFVLLQGIGKNAYRGNSTLFYKSRNFTVQEIGFMRSVASAVSMFLVPATNYIADRLGKRSFFFVVYTVVCAVAVCLTAFLPHLPNAREERNLSFPCFYFSAQETNGSLSALLKASLFIGKNVTSQSPDDTSTEICKLRKNSNGTDICRVYQETEESCWSAVNQTDIFNLITSWQDGTFNKQLCIEVISEEPITGNILCFHRQNDSLTDDIHKPSRFSMIVIHCVFLVIVRSLLQATLSTQTAIIIQVAEREQSSFYYQSFWTGIGYALGSFFGAYLSDVFDAGFSIAFYLVGISEVASIIWMFLSGMQVPSAKSSREQPGSLKDIAKNIEFLALLGTVLTAGIIYEVNLLVFPVFVLWLGGSATVVGICYLLGLLVSSFGRFLMPAIKHRVSHPMIIIGMLLTGSLVQFFNSIVHRQQFFYLTSCLEGLFTLCFQTVPQEYAYFLVGEKYAGLAQSLITVFRFSPAGIIGGALSSILIEFTGFRGTLQITGAASFIIMLLYFGFILCYIRTKDKLSQNRNVTLEPDADTAEGTELEKL